jgi:cytochrome c-type biogenesis protein
MTMTFLIVSFIAGVLTVLAPCVLPILPVIIGSSASGRSRWTPYIVVTSLGISIILFTFLLKVSTAFIMIPSEFWAYLSGGILAVFGLVLLFPVLWEKLPGVAKLQTGSNRLVGSGYQRKSFFGDALIGAALGPVFSACSPTYFVILASVLPVSFALGTVYLLFYVIGLSLVLLMIALLGQRFADRLTGISNPRGYFKRGVGIVFVILGFLIASGYEKKIEIAILDSGYFDITHIEQSLLERVR